MDMGLYAVMFLCNIMMSCLFNLILNIEKTYPICGQKLATKLHLKISKTDPFRAEQIQI